METVEIPRGLEIVEERPKEGKWLMEVVSLCIYTFTRLILSIDVNCSNGVLRPKNLKMAVQH